MVSPGHVCQHRMKVNWPTVDKKCCWQKQQEQRRRKQLNSCCLWPLDLDNKVEYVDQKNMYSKEFNIDWFRIFQLNYLVGINQHPVNQWVNEAGLNGDEIASLMFCEIEISKLFTSLSGLIRNRCQLFRVEHSDRPCGKRDKNHSDHLCGTVERHLKAAY